MRQGEILGLSWNEIDFNKGTILIKQQLQRIGKEYKIVTVKNSKPRTISPAGFVMNIIKEEKVRQDKWKEIAGSAWKNDNNLVFTNEIGGHLYRGTIYKNLKRVAEEIGLPDLRFHDLRHSYAVAALRAGVLGHHTAGFTLDTYAHVTDQMKKESAERMDKFINRFT